MPFYRLPTAGTKQEIIPPQERSVPHQPAAAAPPPAEQPFHAVFPAAVPGLLRLLLRAVAVRAAASGRLVDEQEERQLHLLRISTPASAPVR